MCCAIHSRASGFSPAKSGNCCNSSDVTRSESVCGIGPSLSISHVLVDEVEHNGAFANAIGNAADRTVADVTDGEDARHIGFEQVWIAIQVPARWALPVTQQVRAGHKE